MTRLRLPSLVTSETSHAELLRMSAGLLQFVVLARTLTVDDYGRLALIYVISAFIVPVSTIPATTGLVRRAAVGEAGRGLLDTCAKTLVGSCAMTVLIVSIANPWLPASPLVVGLIIGSECVSACTVQALASLAQGRQEFGSYRRYLALFAVVRVSAVLVFAVFAEFAVDGVSTLTVWGFTIWTMTAIAGLAVLARGFRTEPRIFGAAEQVPRGSLRQNAVFAVNALCTRLSDDLDKAVLGIVATYETVAVYSVAYRIAAYVLFPIRAIMSRALPEYFALGRDAPERLPATMKGTAKDLVVAFVLTMPLLAGGALMLTLLFGEQYHDSRTLAFVLIPALAVRGFQWIFSDALMALGRLRLRLLAQIASFGIPAAICIVLTLKFGVWGAVVATVLGELVAIVILGMIFRMALRGERASALPAQAVRGGQV